MPHINYIELNVPDPQQAAEFYKKVFNWDPQGWGGDSDYLVVSHGEEPGIDSALRKAPDGQPLATPIITVPSLNETIITLQQAGAEIVVERFSIEGVGYAAYFKDAGGLIVGIHEHDENAKE